ncbi:hypothetical protein KOW79_007785 [Hemibagrus wyckioides]|uniref:Uncharacterized protein n=1 Tax=Hemibagrus wyckioides TaxID=337641 RepID=A0A9D3NW36_9TELE|nr:hypothetical protein KOW79_007785 [Hemibagrus wyckioides]
MGHHNARLRPSIFITMVDTSGNLLVIFSVYKNLNRKADKYLDGRPVNFTDAIGFSSTTSTDAIGSTTQL